MVMCFPRWSAAQAVPSEAEAAGAEAAGAERAAVSLRGMGRGQIDSMLLRANELVLRQPETAELLYREALNRSGEQSWLPGIAAAYAQLSRVVANKGQLDTAASYAWEAIRYYTFQRNRQQLAMLYAHLSGVYNKMGAYDKAIRLAADMLPAYDLEDPVQKKYFLSHKGHLAEAYIRTANTGAALFHLQEIIQIAGRPDVHTYEPLGGAYYRMSMLASDIGAHDYALTLATACEKIALAFRDSMMLAKASTNKALLYYNADSLDQALRYVSQSLALTAQDDQLASFRTDNIRVLAGISGKRGDYPRALALAQQALATDLQRTPPVYNDLVRSYAFLGNIHMAMGAYDLAEAALLKAQEIAATRSLFIRDQGEIARLLAFNYRAKGAYREALAYQDQYYAIRDSVAGQTFRERMAQMEALYKLAQKDQQIAAKELEAQRNLNRQYLWIGMSILMLLLLIGFMFYTRSRLALSRIRAQLYGEEQERTRMARELHDGIVGQLSIVKTSISGLRDVQGQDEDLLEEAIRQLDQSITELRNTSHNLMPDMLLHNGLVHTLEEYFWKINAAGQLQVTLQMVDPLPPVSGEFQLTLYRIVQELMQNIIKYAGATEVLVQFNTHKTTLELTIEDNGHGEAYAERDAAGGAGLLSLDARMRYLNGSMEVEAVPGRGTTVYLSFPVGR